MNWFKHFQCMYLYWIYLIITHKALQVLTTKLKLVWLYSRLVTRLVQTSTLNYTRQCNAMQNSRFLQELIQRNIIYFLYRKCLSTAQNELLVFTSEPKLVWLYSKLVSILVQTSTLNYTMKTSSGFKIFAEMDSKKHFFVSKMPKYCSK